MSKHIKVLERTSTDRLLGHIIRVFNSVSLGTNL